MTHPSAPSLDLTEVLSSALLVPHSEISDELLCLAAIYPTLSIKRFQDDLIELELPTCLNHDDSDDDISPQDVAEGTASSSSSIPFELVLSIPLQSYPEIEPPRIQLSSIYLGPFLIPSELHRQILQCFKQPDQSPLPGKANPASANSSSISRTRDHHDDKQNIIQVDWTPGEVVLFDAVQIITDACSAWYRERSKKANQDSVNSALEIGAQHENESSLEDGISDAVKNLVLGDEHVYCDPSYKKKDRNASASQGIKIWSSDPLVDRKSVFVGHTATVHSQAEVDQVMSELLSDKKIAKATHNISAFRYHDAQTHALYHDVDDDGETAAGGRLGHLLNLLAARDALQVGGFLGDEGSGNKKKSGKK
ncbi:BQ2448_4101 [Microbotryum intermedium]|uniref:BQ2448_4101 protein n=1 Tax=Microbotryum intermedium TaxID=269621 RepID=A0A238FL10_9BASI|nr:BQ2448_4101 [Microbotryum intermedium]